MAEEQGKGTVNLNYGIPVELHARIKAEADQQGRTVKAWLLRALTEVVERQEGERAKRSR